MYFDFKKRKPIAKTSCQMDCHSDCQSVLICSIEMIHVKSLISMAQISYIFKKFPTVLKVSKEGEYWVTEKEEWKGCFS